MDIHAEITYDRESGESVHSDICPPECKAEGMVTEDYRKYLHACLDEWLNESRGTGGFYIGAAILKEDLNMELGDKLYRDL
jgi:hypothetical protein